MNKYDYGYELLDDTTNKWAFDQIACNATVLELGPSNGNLIYNLTTQKQCTADIVELDEEAGNQAASFARNSCIGIDEGNLEKDFWYQKLNENHYDYIVMLDVLEHIRNPKEVLLLLSKLLNEHGKILLSIPNIAHNSVIINLLQNKLEYTSVGLLDNTHVHFYTCQSAIQMIEGAGLTIEKCEIKQVAVNNNEIDAVYGVLPREVDAYMKTRDLGTAYQFLLTVSKESLPSETMHELAYQKDTLYTVAAFDSNGNELAEKKVNPLDKIQLEISVPIGTESIRIDPLDKNCIISSVSLIGKTGSGKELLLPIIETTGNLFGDQYVFYDDDPQIYFSVPPGIKKLFFSCQIDIFDSTALAILAPSRDIFRQSNADYLQVCKLYERSQLLVEELQVSLENTKMAMTTVQNEKILLQTEKSQTDQDLAIANNAIVDMNRSLSEKNEALTKLNMLYNQLEDRIIFLQKELALAHTDIEDLRKELDNIANSTWGKIYHKLHR